jgi:hypothetical protein
LRRETRKSEESSLHRTARRHFAALMVALMTFANATAYGQELKPQPLPSPGVYPTPLYQTTQETYVPQSVALSGPREIKDWEKGDPVPPGFHPAHRARKDLIVGGAVIFGVLYFMSTMGAAIVHDAHADGGRDNADALNVPAVGPFIQMIRTSTATGNWLNAMDGGGQIAGIVMVIVGLTSPKTILVRNDLGTVRAAPLPYVGSHGAGFGLVGSF